MSHLARPVALIALIALTACSEGYQGKGDTVFLHYGISRQEAMEAMNQIGNSRFLPQKTGFALLDNCVLEWHTQRWFRGKGTPQTASLLRTEPELARQPDGEHFRVALTADAESGDAPGVTVLAHAPWTEATQMKWLLDYVRRFC